MAKNKLKLLAPAISLLGASLLTPAVMATDPSHGINYSGGVELGVGNTIEAPELVEALQPIMKHRDVTITVSNSTRWKRGYLKEAADKCLPVNYIRVADDAPVTEDEDVSFTITKDGYSAKVDINSITTVNISDGQKTTVGVLDDADFVYAGWQIYTTAECDNEHIADDFSEHFGIRPTENDRVFVEMNVKLFKNNKPFVHNGIFFGITDIDAAQSYKILNEDNILTADNMFVKSKSDLQDPDNEYSLKNMFVADGNYIYSQYNSENGATLGNPEKSNIYVPLLETTQTNGIDLVFGFGSGAASGIEYYTYQFNATYESDENGTISDITTEKIFPTENPSGSKTTPAEGYELSYWVADQDVELNDGTEIKKGEPISDEKIKEVVVNSDITFTAIHEKGVKVPDTGSYLIEDNQSAAMIQLSATVFSVAAVIAFCIAHLKHKKVGFNK